MISLNQIAKDIILLTLQSADWQSDTVMSDVTNSMIEKLNTVLNDMGTVAVIQCNELNNNELMDGLLNVSVMLVSMNDLSTDTIYAHARYGIDSVDVTIDGDW